MPIANCRWQRPALLRIKEENENEDESGRHASLFILLILLILSASSGQYNHRSIWPSAPKLAPCRRKAQHM